MTGPEHYAKAEKYLATAHECRSAGDLDRANHYLASAQIHATLAHTAATALTGVMAKSVSWDLELDEWGRVASDQWPSG